MKKFYLGPFHDLENTNMVQVGEMQSLVWLASELNSDEDGPVYLPPQKSRIEREDRLVPVKLKKYQTEFEPKDKTRADLIKEIMEEDKRFSMLLGGHPALENKSLKELQRDYRNLGIDKMKMFIHRVSPGYLGRGKGYVQVLWERRLIDVKIIKDYVIRK